MSLPSLLRSMSRRIKPAAAVASQARRSAHALPAGMAMPPATVLIEGNIAAGKTGLVQYLERRLEGVVQAFTEPVDKWRRIETNGGDVENALALMYEDPRRWALMFQNYVQLTMLDWHTRPTTAGRVKLMERSIFSARACFVENLKAAGLICPVDYAVLSQWYDWIRDNVRPRVDLIVYLRTEPAACRHRLRARALRAEEDVVSLEYLASLHELHEDWLRRPAGVTWLPDGVRPAVVTVDANGSPRSVVDECERRVVPAILRLAGTGGRKVDRGPAVENGYCEEVVRRDAGVL